MLLDYAYEIILLVTVLGCCAIKIACRLPDDYLPISALAMQAVRDQIRALLIEQQVDNKGRRKADDKSEARKEVKQALGKRG